MTATVWPNVADDQTWRTQRRGPRIHPATVGIPTAGACKGQAHLFDMALESLASKWPANNAAPTPSVVAAKALCGSCDIREMCLQWALAAGESHGVLGGLTPDERRARRHP